MSIHSKEGRGIVNRRDEYKYASILQAAVQVMAESGYHNAQISRIAKAAGVADGTVYLYFKNKEDLLISILRQTIGRIVDKGTEALKTVSGSRLKLHQLVSLYFRELGSDAKLAMVTQVHLRQVDANIRRVIGDIMRPFYDAVDSIVDEGIREGSFRQHINRRIARRMIFGTMDETVTAWVLTGSKYELCSLVDDVVDVLLHGLCTDSNRVK